MKIHIPEQIVDLSEEVIATIEHALKFDTTVDAPEPEAAPVAESEESSQS